MHSDGFFTATLACVSCVSAVCWMKSNLHITARIFHQGADWSPEPQPCIWVLHAVVLMEARVPLCSASHAQGWIQAAASKQQLAKAMQDLLSGCLLSCFTHQRTRLTCCWTCSCESADTTECAAANMAKSASVRSPPTR